VKLTKQQLINVIKEELNTMLQEDYDINADPYLPSAANYFLNPDSAGYNVSGLGYDTLFGPGTSEAAARQLSRRARTHYEDPWEEARAAGETGWGPWSLEESIKENLANILKELDTAAVSVRVKKLPQSGDPPSPRYLTPAQANLLGPGLKPGTPGEVPEEEWKKGGRVKFAWPRGVKGVGRRKTRYIQKDYLQTDPWG